MSPLRDATESAGLERRDAADAGAHVGHLAQLAGVDGDAVDVGDAVAVGDEEQRSAVGRPLRVDVLAAR